MRSRTRHPTKRLSPGWLARLSAALLLLGAAACDDTEATEPPPWPPLQGPSPSHGLESLELRSFQAEAEAEEGQRRQLVLRRDGCFRTEETSSDGGETITVACSACVDAEAVESLFREVASHRAATVRVMGATKSIAPPITLGQWRGFLSLTTGSGESRRAGAGDETLERIARRLHEGVPGAPALGDDDCVRIESR